MQPNEHTLLREMMAKMDNGFSVHFEWGGKSYTINDDFGASEAQQKAYDESQLKALKEKARFEALNTASKTHDGTDLVARAENIYQWLIKS